MRITFLKRLCGLCAVALLGAGCGESTKSGIEELDTGYLTIEWSIGGQRDATACGTRGASGFETVIFDSDGYFVAELEAPCRRFETSIELYQGRYIGRCRLIDVNEESASEIARIDVMDIKPNAEAVYVVDFAATPPQ